MLTHLRIRHLTVSVLPRIIQDNFFFQVDAFLKNPKVKGVVILTYGSGNGPSEWEYFLDALREAKNRGVILINVSQCPKASVEAATYEAGRVTWNSLFRGQKCPFCIRQLCPTIFISWHFHMHALQYLNSKYQIFLANALLYIPHVLVLPH